MVTSVSSCDFVFLASWIVPQKSVFIFLVWFLVFFFNGLIDFFLDFVFRLSCVFYFPLFLLIHFFGHTSDFVFFPYRNLCSSFVPSFELLFKDKDDNWSNTVCKVMADNYLSLRFGE